MVVPSMMFAGLSQDGHGQSMPIPIGHQGVGSAMLGDGLEMFHHRQRHRVEIKPVGNIGGHAQPQVRGHLGIGQCTVVALSLMACPG